jgi:hypothetical protein
MNLQVARSEIVRITGQYQFFQLPLQQQSAIVAQVFRSRPDTRSQEVARLVESGTPSLKSYEVLEDLTGVDPRL